MLKVTVNNSQTLDIQAVKENILVNNEPFNWDLLKISDNKFHVLKDNKSFNAEVVEANYAEKIFKLKINQNIYTVNLKDRTDLLLEKMGMSNVASNKLKELKAPMPGLIFELKVKVGDEIQKGDVLLILVAMKMENAIKAAGNGKVKSIKVKLNDTVDKGQVIMEFE
jgi:biotin carboxyl carrier protein